MSEWQPIETAPKGAPVLVWIESGHYRRCCIARNTPSGWHTDLTWNAYRVTHWMPLPEPPQ